MAPLDRAVFLAYLAVVLAVGARFARRQRRFGEYFLAGRSMHWLPVGLSTMVTAFSAINYTAFSGEVFEHGLYVSLCLPVFLFVAPVVIRLVMPLYHEMGIRSVYEYLEKRFDRRVRRLGSGLFILWAVLWMATLLYVPCRVLSLITHYDETSLILLTGVVVTAYTVAGGMRAVMWTDVLQFLVLAGGLVVGLAVASARAPGGLVGILQHGVDCGLARPFEPFDPGMLSLDPRVRITLWSCWAGTFVAFLARYGTDQAVVQRYLAARSLEHARRGFHLAYGSVIVALVALGLLGFAIHAHAAEAGWLDGSRRPPIYYFAEFVRALPSGVPGLIVAGLGAATMSSMDSGINSCAAVWVADFGPGRSGATGGAADEQQVSRLPTLAFGGAATLLALEVGRLGSVFEIANRVINGMGTPLLALSVLALFSRRATAAGTLAGGTLGILGSALVTLGVPQLALHYYAVANLALTAALIYLCSLAGKRPSPAQLAWTWGGRRRAP
ncbi:MAG: sodium/solute symporter [Candidatus Latescibacterota bacterium]